MTHEAAFCTPLPPGQLPRGHSSIMEPPEISQGKIWQLPRTWSRRAASRGVLAASQIAGAGSLHHGAGAAGRIPPGAIWQRAASTGKNRTPLLHARTAYLAMKPAGSFPEGRGRGRILAASPGKNRTPLSRGISQNSKALYSCHWSHGAAGTGRTSQRIPRAASQIAACFPCHGAMTRHHEAASF